MKNGTGKAAGEEGKGRSAGAGKIAVYAAAGLVSGIVLGLSLKIVQGLTGHRVYRLLLNTDYVPLLNRFRLSEWAEFVIHLFISVALCVVLGLLWQRWANRRMPSAASMAAVTAAIGVLIGLLLYPTTLLSQGGTPPIGSLPSWLWWLGAHLLYGAASGLLLHACLRFPRETFLSK